MRLNSWLGLALIAICIGAEAQTIHKCVGKDGKTAYSNEPCPGSKEIRPPAAQAAQGADARKEPSARPAAGNAPILPETQAGKWKLRYTKNGAVNDIEICGDPLDTFRSELKSYATENTPGCTLVTNAPSPGSVRIVHDCPADQAGNARAVRKGRSELWVVSSSPQAFRVEMKSTAYVSFSVDGTRIGSCAPG